MPEDFLEEVCCVPMEMQTLDIAEKKRVLPEELVTGGLSPPTRAGASQ